MKKCAAGGRRRSGGHPDLQNHGQRLHAGGLRREAERGTRHGQRGGSVSTQVRWGDKGVPAPCSAKGEADILVALEKMGGCAHAEFLKPGGVAVINDYAIKSTIASGAETYLEGCVEAMEKGCSAPLPCRPATWRWGWATPAHERGALRGLCSDSSKLPPD